MQRFFSGAIRKWRPTAVSRLSRKGNPTRQWSTISARQRTCDNLGPVRHTTSPYSPSFARFLSDKSPTNDLKEEQEGNEKDAIDTNEEEEEVSDKVLISTEVEVVPLKLRLPDDSVPSDVLQWFKEEGDLVNAGDLVCEIDTDLYSYDFASPVTGFLAKILTPTGSKQLQAGQSIAYLAETKAEISKVVEIAEEKYNKVQDQNEKQKHENVDASVGQTQESNIATNGDVQEASTMEESEEYEDSARGFLSQVEAKHNVEVLNYESAFKSDGFNREASIVTLDEEDLRELGVRKGHRRLILKEIEVLKLKRETEGDK